MGCLLRFAALLLVTKQFYLALFMKALLKQNVF